MNTLRTFQRLVRLEMKWNFLSLRRYPLELLSMFIVTFMLFVGLFLGAQYFSGAIVLGDRVSDAILSYTTWFLTIGVVTGIASVLQAEIQTGLLEHIHISAYNPLTIYLARSIASIGQQLALTIILILSLSWATGIKVHFELTSLAGLLPIILAAQGIGFILGAITQMVKKIGQTLSLFQFGLLFYLVIPVENWSGTAKAIGAGLPLLSGVGFMRSVSAGNTDWQFYWIATATSLGWFLLSLWLFQAATRTVKKNGQISHY